MSDVAVSAIAELVESYYSELRIFARRKLGNAAIAEDIVQEACLRFATSNGRIDNPRAFLYRIVGNLVIDYQRKVQRRERRTVSLGSDIEIIDDTIDIERQLAARQRLALLSKAIGELPPRCRECFVLRRFDDLDHDQIARQMGISRNMVEKHLRLAVAHCAQRLREGD